MANDFSGILRGALREVGQKLKSQGTMYDAIAMAERVSGPLMTRLDCYKAPAAVLNETVNSGIQKPVQTTSQKAASRPDPNRTAQAPRHIHG